MKFLPFIYEQPKTSNFKNFGKKNFPNKDVIALPSILKHSHLSNILNQNLNNKRDPELYRAESTDAEQNERGKKEELKNEISKVYVKNTDHTIYLLKFKTKDIWIEPVYLKDRVFEENPNDKCVQLPSKVEYKNLYNIHSSKMNCLRKKYKLNKSSDHVSIMSSKRPIMKKSVYELPPAKKERTISSSFSNIKKSVIYLYHNDILFSVYPGVLEVKTTKLISNEGSDKSFIEITDLKNRAHVVVRYKKDVLKFCFTLTEISYEKVKEKITTGIQTQDDNIYIRGFSEITNREVYYPIPISNYNYKDPLVDIHQKNMDLKLNKLEARWMSETRKKRIREYRKCRYPDPYKNLIALRNGSYLNFDVGNTENKTQFEVGSLQVNDDAYENWVISKQKEVYQSAVNQRKNELEAENNFNDMYADANFKNASEKCIKISDWDLICFQI